ncbi:transporting ATPase [Klebsiella variicola]|uniref:Transporting ATPase n=1 Tax=Klebsiella variicola TaxID=244366 RepID=A0A7H4MPT5_KLEVA|nr:transporting ATPase [Klebsiella variicola]
MTQSQFEDVEVKPQAYEWLFCVAAGFPFNVSCDNLEGDVEPDRIAFQRRVHARVMTLLEQGIPNVRRVLFAHCNIIIKRRH